MGGRGGKGNVNGFIDWLSKEARAAVRRIRLIFPNSAT